MVTLRNVTMAFGENTLFSSVDCTIGSGEKVGLIGRNGSGKSTLLKLLMKSGGLEVLPIIRQLLVLKIQVFIETILLSMGL